MANPQVEDGFCKIANELIEALARIRIPGEAMQILLVIIRETYGWNKKEDAISLSQFVAATGMRRPNVCRAITKLLAINIIIKKDTPTASKYRLNKDFDSWKPLSKKISPVSKKIIGSLQKDNKVVSKKIHTKDIKDNNTNTYIADAEKRAGKIKSGKKKRDEKTEAELVAEYRATPDKSWNAVLLAYRDHYGHLPTWAVSDGSVQEFRALAAALKKLNGDKEELLECFRLYLRDDEDYIVANAHRPSLINKRLDGYLTRVRKTREPLMVKCRDCGESYNLKEIKICPHCKQRREKELAQGKLKPRGKELKDLTGKLAGKFSIK